MKIAYVTPYSSDDVHAWSGSVHFIREALRKAGCEIVPVDALHDPGRLMAKVKEKAIGKLLGKRWFADRRSAVLEAYARQVAARCAEIRPDVIFSPGSIPVAALETKTPVVFWTDATFAGVENYYPLFTNLTRAGAREGHHVDKLVLKNAALAIYTSEWAARSAVERYGADPAKVKVVPYGANVSQRWSAEDVCGFLEKRKPDVLRLLFAGVEWERKGGSVALDAASELNARGVKTELHVMGCEPPADAPDFVVRHGFVSKKTPEGKALFEHLFSESHFLIVPTRAECFGLVFAEAASFGLPSLGADTGGVASVVRDEVNGKLFPLGAGGAAYADWIQQVAGNEERYRRLALDSLKEFDSRLNWDVAGKSVVEMMRVLA
ncbi:MAG: glycosyltransferase family 4 protein [Luteolibacter sp.]